jgi:hypothetical protein
MVIVSLLSASGWVFADAKAIRLDLATLPVDQVTTRPGGEGTYTFTLVNKIPAVTYRVDIAREAVAMPALTFPGVAAGGRGGDSPPAAPGSCDTALAQMLLDLADAKTESAVKAAGQKAIGDSDASCVDDVRIRFKALTELPIDEGDSFSVGPGESLTLSISRPGATWTFRLEGTTAGEWRTSYGFFFVHDRDRKYFVEETHPTDASSLFTIREQADRETLDFVPTVLFTFFPRSHAGRTWSGGWTAGLGYDLEKPVLVAGYARSYNENVIFTAGIAFHRQTRLLGRYRVGDVVKESIDSSQLIEDTYGPNVYAGVSFRFGEDIHARRRELEKQAATAQSQAAAAKARAAQAEKEAADRKAACEASANAAQAAANEACKGNEACVATASANAAAAKAKCAVTEQEKHDAEANQQRAAADLAKAKVKELCDTAAKSAYDEAISKCAKDPDKKTCEAHAKAVLDASLLQCAK